MYDSCFTEELDAYLLQKMNHAAIIINSYYSVAFRKQRNDLFVLSHLTFSLRFMASEEQISHLYKPDKCKKKKKMHL